MLDFIGIGAQKAGTTWIAENLARHPQVTFPAGKEVHFWDQYYDKGIGWYKDLFKDGGTINGDITPAYAFIEIEKIKQLHDINPDGKIIYSVRNPIDRAWSAARMMLSRAEMTIEEASDQWFIDLFLSKGSRDRGDYVRAVDSWVGVFGEGQFLLVDFERIKTDPNGLLEECVAHIGADSGFFSKGGSNVIHEKIHQSIGGNNIRPSLLPVLHDLYDKPIQDMAKHPILGKIYGR